MTKPSSDRHCEHSEAIFAPRPCERSEAIQENSAGSPRLSPRDDGVRIVIANTVKRAFLIVIANTVKQSRKTMLGRHGYRLAMTE